jgi:hypothetical protein
LIQWRCRIWNNGEPRTIKNLRARYNQKNTFAQWKRFNQYWSTMPVFCVRVVPYYHEIRMSKEFVRVKYALKSWGRKMQEIWIALRFLLN